MTIPNETQKAFEIAKQILIGNNMSTPNPYKHSNPNAHLLRDTVKEIRDKAENEKLKMSNAKVAKAGRIAAEIAKHQNSLKMSKNKSN